MGITQKGLSAHTLIGGSAQEGCGEHSWHRNEIEVSHVCGPTGRSRKRFTRTSRQCNRVPQNEEAQIIAVLSPLPVMMWRPSAEKATEVTGPLCPRIMSVSLPVCESHSLAV